ncbi:hypothetical protein BH23BAC1_BH23BAC1_06230 [soil metagenome]
MFIFLYYFTIWCLEWKDYFFPINVMENILEAIKRKIYLKMVLFEMQWVSRLNKTRI